MIRRANLSLGLLLLFTFPLVSPSAERATRHKKPTTAVESLWQNPSDIHNRNLFYGSGGKDHAPSGPFTFEKEDLDGTNPKFVVRDDRGTKWKVKLGEEARPETVATRLVWAVGYSVNEDYFLSNIQVDELPSKLKRGNNLRRPGGVFHDVRLKREDKQEKKIEDWSWRRNPFSGTREMNGLRVMMALINNWDLKDQNNTITSRQTYIVSDLGASFGANGFSGRHVHDKGNLHSYEHSKFIRKATAKYVNFATPGRPGIGIVFNPKEYISRTRMESIAKQIPRKDARWIGEMLAQLSPAQIRDAFRSASYSPEQVEGFAKIVETRIAELNRL